MLAQGVFDHRPVDLAAGSAHGRECTGLTP